MKIPREMRRTGKKMTITTGVFRIKTKMRILRQVRMK